MAGLGLNTIALAHLVRYRGKSVLIILGLTVAVAAFVSVMSLVLSLQTDTRQSLGSVWRQSHRGSAESRAFAAVRGDDRGYGRLRADGAP